METIKIIARIRSDFPEKFGIPRQSGVVPETRAEIVFEKPYQNPDALRGVEGFSHLWLIWGFSACERMLGRRRCARRGWAATRAWVCSPRGRRFAPIPSGCRP